jgi:hypothetical protein
VGTKERRMATTRLWPVGFIFLAGCFPLELDVNSKGEVLIYRQEGFLVYHPASGKVTPVAGPRKGFPAFARFAPDGKNLLLVVKDGSMPGQGFRFDLVPRDGGPGRTLYRGDKTTYTHFASSGSQLAITRLADTKKFKEAVHGVPELILLDVASGAITSVIPDVCACFCWFADSKRLLLGKISHVDQQGQYTGQLEEYDVATRTSKPLAAFISDDRMVVDLSPDNETALFIARGVGRPGENLTLEGRDNPRHAFQLQLADRSVSKLKENTDFARYSPSGKKILLQCNDGLLVADLAEKYFTTVVEPDDSITARTTAPGWIDDDSFFYFQERSTLGERIKGLSLVTIKCDGSDRQVVQPLLDRAALEAETKYASEAPPSGSETPFSKGEPRPWGEKGDMPPATTAEEWDNTMTIVVAGFAGVLLLFGLVRVLTARGSRSAGKEQPTPQAASSQIALRFFVVFFAIAGCAGTTYLAWMWRGQVNDPRVQEFRQMLPLVKLIANPAEEGKIQEELNTLEKRGKTLYFLYGAIVLGALGGILGLLRIAPAFAALFLLMAVVAPAIFIPITVVFTCPFLLAAALASRLRTGAPATGTLATETPTTG